ncbi:hypothetical protein NE236_15685 [Actinoallomurus purpureus]|uniref:hypothetical protein n=1 Tax=Actinoallomurus purpureus TaxID=478114 RepID=UPI00209254A7|nr:hypothetical protein [Actinoallomurus purpureus]MCO6006426.1 hypothetical protein [Actinoallomurus purpureus]
MGASTMGDDFAIRATGPATEGGRLSLSEVARIAGGVQATLERLALSLSGGAVTPGRRPREIVDAVRLDFVGFAAGSAVLKLARGHDTELLERSLDALRVGAEEIRRNPGRVPRHFTQQVITGLRALSGGVGSGGISKIELLARNVPICSIDEEFRDLLHRLERSTTEEEVTVVGRLHMGDLSPASLRCRIDTFSGSILCDFDAGMRDAVLDAMDQLVMASGTAEVQPDGSTVRLLHIEDLSVVRETRSKTLATLAREQGIAPVRGATELHGGEAIDDFEDFLAAVRSARRD